MRVKLLLALAGAALSGACAPLQENAEVLELKTPQMTTVSYTASLRGAYIVPGDSKLRYCAEPAPDTALDSLQKLAAEVSVTVPQGAEGSAEFASELQAKVVQLAGRTQLVLLAREMLYRACELSLNHPEKSVEALELYTKVADIVRELGISDRTYAQADLFRQSKGVANATKLLEDFQKSLPPN
jgi:hypothetical protein